MASFYYEARDNAGSKVSGELMADTEREAVRQLQGQGFYVLKLQQQKASGASSGMSPLSWFGRSVLEPVFLPVSSKALSLFFSSFASMLAAGMNIHEAAAHLGQRAHGFSLRNAAQEMSAAALEGKPITTVARRFPGAFPRFVTAMLQAADLGGTLEDTMRLISQYYAKTHEVEQEYRFQTFYFKIMFFIVIFVPLIPSMVLGGFRTAIAKGILYLLLVLLIVALVWYSWRLLMRVPLLRAIADRLKLSIPLVKGIVRRNMTAKWCRSMAMLSDAGVPLSSALEAAGEAAGNMAVARRMKSLAPQVMEGVPVSEIMMQSREFDDIAINMMLTGERSGDISGSLVKVAEYAESEAHTSSKQSALLVYVILMLIIAVITAFIVISFWTGYFDSLLNQDIYLSDFP